MHDAHFSAQLRALHDALLSIVAVINRPERDEVLMRDAGIQLDRALFPLLVLVERYGPIGIVDLAGRVGRDHSVISRQVGRLIALGLAEHVPDPSDRRVRMAAPTAQGRAMARAIDAARERFGRAALAEWSDAEVTQLVTLMSRFAAAISQESTRPPPSDAPSRQ